MKKKKTNKQTKTKKTKKNKTLLVYCVNTTDADSKNVHGYYSFYKDNWHTNNNKEDLG